MFYMKEYEGDALAITDAEVTANWRMGVLRGVARVLKIGGLPLGGTDRWGKVQEGTNRAHLTPAGLPFGGAGEGCSISELYELEEESDKEYVFSTNGGSEYDVTVISGKATCACGRLVKEPVRMNITPGDLIAEVMNAE